MGTTKGQNLRVVLLRLDDIEDLQDALDKLTTGQGLTAGESGVAAVESVASLTLLGMPEWYFDGFCFCMALYYTSG